VLEIRKKMIYTSPLFIALVALPGIRQVSLFDTQTATHVPLDSHSGALAPTSPRSVSRLHQLAIRDSVEDIVIVQEHYTFILRPLEGETNEGRFIQITLDPEKANLAQVRQNLATMCDAVFAA
jgi:hypothetical protein